METLVKGTESLLSRYERIRNQTVKICAPLLAEDHVVQPIVDVSPPKWHLGHTTWFFETFILKKYMAGYKVFDEAYNYVFNSYYETIGDRLTRSHRGNLTRPSVREIHTYRKYVDVWMKELLESPLTDDQIHLLAELGLQHEQQHQELLVTDIKYILGNNPLFPQYQRIREGKETEVPALEFVKIPGGVYKIGSVLSGFCFDNEQPAHECTIENFSIANRLVTNQEYLEFVEQGGYQDFRYWLMEGWEMVKALHWEAPLYWMKKEGVWYEYTLTGLQKLRKNNPVAHISFYEAEAFAKWSGKRLPTEFEWEAAASYLKADPQNGNFLETDLFHPSPAMERDTQLLGQLWEWTYSAYHPYPGYRAVEGAIGEYNGKFMISQMVLRGGSCATPRDHIRISYRNFFHPDKRWQFTGIRLCERI